MRYHGRMSARALIRLVGLLLILLPREAAAQWYGVATMGANTTAPADILIDRSAASTKLTFENVEFESRSFNSPPYYGARLGRLFGPDRRWGLELEFIHAKVIALTAAAYRVSGTANNVAIDTTVPMSILVERYAMTHGLNFGLINVLSRTPLGDGPVTFVARAGGGVTIPHAESHIGGAVLEQYEFGGFAAHGAAGLDVRLGKGFSAVGEYKLTWSRPEIEISGGTGRMSALSHHIAFGLAFGLGR